MTVQERVKKYNQEAIDNLFEASESEQKFEGFFSIVENKKNMKELVKIQEKIIEDQHKLIEKLEKSAALNIAGGFALGVLVSLIFYILSI
jgi:predicted ribosome quality control (RQC) complex YloA/Tae2 family protein